jgi:CO dehydrogenase/acetyl-CoA synthase delta subunit
VKTLGEEEKNATTDLAGLLKLLGLDGKREIELEDVELDVEELVLEPSASASTAPKTA